LGDENVTPTFASVGDPATVDSLVDDDWLRIGSGIAVFDADAGFVTFRIDWDIRVKRKVKSNQVLRFVLENGAGGNAISCIGSTRTLIALRI